MTTEASYLTLCQIAELLRESVLNRNYMYLYHNVYCVMLLSLGSEAGLIV